MRLIADPVPGARGQDGVLRVYSCIAMSPFYYNLPRLTELN
jgi:hypothetical protein